MEGTQTQEQPTDKKVEWAQLSDDEEQDTKSQPKAAVKKAPKKKSAANTAAKTQANSKIASNVFVCDELEADDDDEEVEQTTKKEKKGDGQSFKDFVGQKKDEIKEGIKAVLSKKDQKKKELEDFDKILQDFKTTVPETPQTEGATTEDKSAQEKENTQPEAEAGAGGEGENKKKKKKKKAKEGENKEGDQKAEGDQKVEEEKEKEPEGEKPTGPVDVEKKIQEIMKNKAKQNASKKQGLNLETAKQEILARQQKKTKKKYEDL